MALDDKIEGFDHKKEYEKIHEIIKKKLYKGAEELLELLSKIDFLNKIADDEIHSKRDTKK